MKVNGSFGVNSSGNLQRSSAFLQKGKFERSGFQKYEQPTKVFCLIETWEEHFSEIKLSVIVPHFVNNIYNCQCWRQHGLHNSFFPANSPPALWHLQTFSPIRPKKIHFPLDKSIYLWYFYCASGLFLYFFVWLRQFQNSSKPSKSPRFDLQQGAFSAVTIQVATSNYPLQIFANVFFVIFWKTFEITSYEKKRRLVWEVHPGGRFSVPGGLSFFFFRRFFLFSCGNISGLPHHGSAFPFPEMISAWESVKVNHQRE